MKSCSECAFYHDQICQAWLIPAKPNDEPCDKFRDKDERRVDPSEIKAGEQK